MCVDNPLITARVFPARLRGRTSGVTGLGTVAPSQAHAFEFYRASFLAYSLRLLFDFHIILFTRAHFCAF